VLHGLVLGLGNLVPLIGVLLYGWDLPQIFLIYWIETAVVGVIGALKIRIAIDARPPEGVESPPRRRRGAGPHVNVVEERRVPVPRRRSDAWVVATVWLVSYLFFWGVLGAFVIDIVNGGFYEGSSATGFAGVPPGTVLGGLLSLVIAHLFGYYRDYIRGERYLTDSMLDLTRTPFARLLVLFGAIVVGGFGTALLGPVGFLVAMIVAKTAIELWWARSAPTDVPSTFTLERASAPAPERASPPLPAPPPAAPTGRDLPAGGPPR
jgi:hypothetical protein